MGTKECGKMLNRIQILPAKEAKNCRIEGEKRRITRKEHQRLSNKFEVEGFMVPKRIMLEKRCCRIGESYLRKRVTSLENTRLCMKKTSIAAD